MPKTTYGIATDLTDIVETPDGFAKFPTKLEALDALIERQNNAITLLGMYRTSARKKRRREREKAEREMLPRFSMKATYATRTGRMGRRDVVRSAPDMDTATSVFMAQLSKAGYSKIDVETWRLPPLPGEAE
jgi:hypothetical protein